MNDELVKRHVEQLRLTGGDLADLCQPLADAIDALTAERDEALNQLDSSRHSVEVLEKRVTAVMEKRVTAVMEKRTAAVMEDRKLILEERDRTFALMLARAEKAEAERDRLREALTRLLAPFGNDACHYDHHGYCQEHFIEADCCVAHARASLKGETE